MASKTTKRARNAAVKSNAPVEKDDGTRWVVMLKNDDGPDYPAYLGGNGVTRSQAERLSEGLVGESYLVSLVG